jgi:hypothetical protein
MFRRCPQAYAFRYVLGLKRPPGASFGFGLSYDAAANEEYEHKMKHGTDLDAAKMQECFASEWAKRKHEVEFKEGEDAGKLNDEGVALVKVFHDEVAVNVQPVAVQEFITVELAGVDYDLSAVLDVVDNKGNMGEVVVDNKTAARAWDQGRELVETQPVAYCIARASIGKPTYQFRFDIGIKGKKPRMDIRTRDVREEEVTGFLKLLAHVRESIVAGVFYPNQGTWACSKRWCAYWPECVKEWHINVKE